MIVSPNPFSWSMLFCEYCQYSIYLFTQWDSVFCAEEELFSSESLKKFLNHSQNVFHFQSSSSCFKRDWKKYNVELTESLN